MGKVGRPKGREKTQLMVYIDKEIITWMRSKMEGEISTFIEKAITFYVENKQDVEEYRMLKNFLYVECNACHARFSLRKFHKCPNCNNRVIILPEEDTVLTQEEKELLTTYTE